MRNLLLSLLTTGVALAAMPAQADVLLAKNDYDAPAYLAPGVTTAGTNDDTETATVGPWNAAGWAGEYVVNRSAGNPATASSVTLFGLAPNSAVRIGTGIIGLLESWDSSNAGPPFSPDYLDIFINGVLVASMTTDTALGSVEDYAGGTKLFSGIQANANTNFSDTLIDITTATFANSFATAVGTWTLTAQARGDGWQGGGDEAWGIDNLSIYGTVAATTPGVPEPATWGLMIAGFAAVGSMLRGNRGRFSLA